MKPRRMGTEKHGGGSVINGHVQLPVEPVNCFRSGRMNCEVYRTSV